MCGRTQTNDILDVSHIFPKSTWPLARFLLLNCKVLCRRCHQWWYANIQDAAEWIQQYLGQRKYAELLEAITNPDPLFRDLSKVEVYLKREIRKYS